MTLTTWMNSIEHEVHLKGAVWKPLASCVFAAYRILGHGYQVSAKGD
eukprot:CAMPEP_0119336888 /NCGR_PEP_ID=MMETSP1333-20130426/92886_1 /TAXON_ID=418940 /ORGANISM="Scyphosphaera apsteinii, Strain RCC1455" /LENGTH=46 /DNA_ID= /DNA_START= /DNA_END= /DNA_ORIENTATION=